MNMCIFSGEIQGGRLLVDALKYRLSLVIPYARTWDQVRDCVFFSSENHVVQNCF